jgi:hypothetical protein
MRLIRITTMAVAALGASLLFTAPALAQPHDRAAGEALFQAARDLMDKGQYDAACKKFEASQRADPAMGTILNLANCYEKLGRTASAWERFEEASQKLAPGDDRLPVAKERAAHLKARLPKLELTLDDAAPPGTQVLRDDVVVDPAALGVALPVDPGAHRLVVKAPGRADAETSVDTRVGQVVKRKLFAGAPNGSPVVAAVPDGQQAPPTDGGSSWWTGMRIGGVVVGGVGVVLLAAGIGEGVAAISDKSTVSASCNTSTRTCTNQGAIDAASSGKTASTVSTVGFVVGGLAVAGGITMIAVGSPAARVTGVVLPGGGAIGVRGAF